MKRIAILIFSFVLTSSVAYSDCLKAEDVIEVTLKGLKLTINKQSGINDNLYYPGVREILDAMTGNGVFVDVAYPNDA
jgi:hypothetical protein